MTYYYCYFTQYRAQNYPVNNDLSTRKCCRKNNVMIFKDMLDVYKLNNETNMRTTYL